MGPKTNAMAPVLAFASTLVPTGTVVSNGILSDDAWFDKLFSGVVVKRKVSPAQGMGAYMRTVNKRIEEARVPNLFWSGHPER